MRRASDSLCCPESHSLSPQLMSRLPEGLASLQLGTCREGSGRNRHNSSDMELVEASKGHRHLNWQL